MISRFLRPACLIGALALTTASVVHGQVQWYFWTGAADSNYLNVANWNVATSTSFSTAWDTSIAATAIPANTADIVFVNAPANKVLNLTHSGSGDYTQQVYSLQAATNLAYTLNLKSTGTGKLIYNIVGRGTHPYNTGATTTATGNTSTRMSFYLNADGNVEINYAGNVNTPNPASSTSGLTYAKVTLTNGARIDASMTTGTLNLTGGSSTLQLGGLSLDATSSVYVGNWGMTISGLNAAGEEERWAGTITQDSYINAEGTRVATATQKWGTGITRVMNTGVVNHPGVFTLRAAGQYLVDGVHNGPITSNASSRAVLGGSGIINGNVTIGNGSSLGPGGRDAAGRLTINGVVNLNGALSIDMLSLSSFDRLDVNGLLDLTPATGTATSSLAVGVSPTFPLQPGRYRVATFTAVDGTFASVALPPSQGLIASYVLGSDYLDIIFTQIAYATNPSLVRNHNTVAGALDRAISAEKLPGELIDYMNRLPSVIFFRDVLDQFSPTCYYGWYPAAVSRSNALTQAVNDRLNQRTERAKGRWDVWGLTYRQESSIDPNDWADYTNFDTMSVTGGVDTMLTPGLVVGGLMSGSVTQTDLNQQFSTSETTSATLGLYAQMTRGALEAQAFVFGGADEYTSERNVEKTQAGKWAEGETDGAHYGVSVSSSYTKKFDWFEISPFVGAQIVSWSAKRFEETGASYANITIQDQKETSVAARGGLRIAQSYSTKYGFIRPFFNVSVVREIGQETRLMDAELFGEALTVTLPGIQKKGMRYDAGIDWDMSKSVSMQVRYSIEKGGTADESLAVRGGVNVSF